MPDKPEARIVTRKQPDGKVELSVYEPSTGREHRTGWCVRPDELDKKVVELKTTLERSGNHVTVKELGL